MLARWSRFLIVFLSCCRNMTLRALAPGAPTASVMVLKASCIARVSISCLLWEELSIRLAISSSIESRLGGFLVMAKRLEMMVGLSLMDENLLERSSNRRDKGVFSRWAT